VAAGRIASSCCPSFVQVLFEERDHIRGVKPTTAAELVRAQAAVVDPLSHEPTRDREVGGQ